jgi:hypothetical protein
MNRRAGGRGLGCGRRREHRSSPLPWRIHLGLRNHAFLLAISLVAAAPVFADGAASNATEASIGGERGDSTRQGARHTNVIPAAFASHNFAVDAIKSGRARVDLGAAGSSRGFSAGSASSEFFGSQNAGLQSSDHPVSAFAVDSGPGNSSGWHGDQDGDKPHGKNQGDRDGAQALIAVAEPGTRMLSLFGFLIMGMIVYRHKGPTNGIYSSKCRTWG